VKFVGLGVAFFGYCVTYYGITQVQGGNWGFFDLVLPTRWNASVAALPRDGQTSETSSAKSSPSGVGLLLSPKTTVLGLLTGGIL
jgi:hypothetical protein